MAFDDTNSDLPNLGNRLALSDGHSITLALINLLKSMKGIYKRANIFAIVKGIIPPLLRMRLKKELASPPPRLKITEVDIKSTAAMANNIIAGILIFSVIILFILSPPKILRTIP